MRILYALLALVFVLGLSRPVQAADLFTGPLGGVGGGVIFCRLANVSTTSQTVRIRVVDAAGTIQVDSGELSVPPGQVRFEGFPNGTLFYCHFTVQGNKDNVRGSISFTPDGLTDTTALSAD